MAPLGDRVLVKTVEPEVQTSSGILLPSSAQKRPTQGNVVSLGAKAEGISDGARVVYSKYAGTEVEVQGSAHIILKEDDVIGVLSGGEDIACLKPLQDRILLEVLESSDTTSGGLVLTDAAKEKPTLGKVIATGPGRKGEDGEAIPLTVAQGSTVLYSKFSGSEFEGSDGKHYIVVRDGDILATVS